MMPLRYL
jgi:hypothetical protein